MSKARDLADNALGSKPKVVDAKGDLIVGTGSDAAARLAVASTAGYVLTVDSATTSGLKWAEAAAGGDFVFISRTDFTSVSSQSLNNVFTSTYDNYRILINFIGSTSTEACRVRMRASGTDATGSDYAHVSLTVTTGSVSASVQASGTSSFVGMNDTVDSAWSLEVMNPALAKRTLFYSLTHFTNNARYIQGRHDLSTAYDGMTFIMDGGTMTGSIVVYGYRKS